MSFIDVVEQDTHYKISFALRDIDRFWVAGKPYSVLFEFHLNLYLFNNYYDTSKFVSHLLLLFM